jgi:hypothetical protein
MITVRDTNKDFIIDFDTLESWDDFETIMDILRKSYDVKVINQIDGPDSRVWDIKLDNFLFSLHNNPYGNYLKAKEPSSIQYLKDTLGHIKVHLL